MRIKAVPNKLNAYLDNKKCENLSVIKEDDISICSELEKLIIINKAYEKNISSQESNATKNRKKYLNNIIKSNLSEKVNDKINVMNNNNFQSSSSNAYNDSKTNIGSNSNINNNVLNNKKQLSLGSCLICNWIFPDNFIEEEVNVHTNLCIEGKGFEHKENYLNNLNFIKNGGVPFI